jgi:AAA family ATP:ADP antiporter
VIALVLMLVIPIYGAVRRRLDGARLLQAITIFFALSMLVFVYIAHSGVNIAFAFFVWVSIYGVMVVAQFWAFAADSFNLKSGQRLFPVIMLGANLGALVGAKCAQLAAAALSPMGLMLVANAALLGTLVFATPERRAVPAGSRALAVDALVRPPRLLGGLGLVFRDRYLLLIALLVVLLNWINSTGEFVLADFVQRDAAARAAQTPGIDAGALITAVLRQLPVLGHARRSADATVSWSRGSTAGSGCEGRCSYTRRAWRWLRSRRDCAAARRFRAGVHAHTPRQDRREQY